MAHIGIIMLLLSFSGYSAAYPSDCSLVRCAIIPIAITPYTMYYILYSIAPSYECRTVLHAYMTDRESYTYYMRGLGVYRI